MVKQTLFDQNEQILNNINTLQQSEIQLTQSLASIQDPSEQDDVIQQINALSSTRIQLYKTIQKMYLFVDNVNPILNNQFKTIKIVEEQLNKTKKEAKLLQATKNNQLRLTEFNSSFAMRYSAYSYMFKVIVLFCLGILVISIVSGKGYLPSSMASILIGLLIVCGISTLIYLYIDFGNRDNMNFATYAFYAPNETNTTTVTSSPISGDSGPSSATISSLTGLSLPTTCIGSACCSAGLQYDSTQNKCVSA